MDERVVGDFRGIVGADGLITVADETLVYECDMLGLVDCVHSGMYLLQCPYGPVLPQELDSPRGRVLRRPA